jgi:lipopolysaccharide exporter
VWGAIALVAIPSAVGIACLADLLTNVVLGPKWAEASPLMGALAAVGALHALHSSYWPMLLTRVGPKTVFLLAAWGGLLTIPVFGGLLYFAGLLPAIGGGIACGIAMLMIGARMLLNDLGGSGVALIVALVRPVIASCVMAGSILSFRGWLPDYTTWSAGLAEMMMMIAFGVLVFTVAVAAMWLVAGRPKGAESELISLVLLRIGKNATNG